MIRAFAGAAGAGFVAYMAFLWTRATRALDGFGCDQPPKRRTMRTTVKTAAMADAGYRRDLPPNWVGVTWVAPSAAHTMTECRTCIESGKNDYGGHELSGRLLFDFGDPVDCEAFHDLTPEQAAAMWDRARPAASVRKVRVDFGGPWDEDGNLITALLPHHDDLEDGCPVKLYDRKGNQCGGHVVTTVDNALLVKADYSTWVDGPDPEQQGAHP